MAQELTAAIVGVMLVCYFALKAEYPWPASLTWNTLPTYLNDFQTWLVDQRNAESPSAVIRAFNGFAEFLDNLVNWFTSFLGWMTWIGVTVAGVLVPTFVLVGAALIPYVDRENITATRPSQRKTAVVLFTLFCIFGLVLTFVGIFFRGPGYTFVIPFVTAPGMYFSL